METTSKEKSYRQSRQRKRILEVLSSTTVHPTADWIYRRLKKEFPRLSMGTVYRNLNILIDQGWVSKIHFGSTFDRFEARVEPHTHLICERCGSITDLNMSFEKGITEKARKLTGFDIRRHRIEFFGICQKCLVKNRSPKKREKNDGNE
ncbi:MAG TPA: transcriptional repressor [bacterium]|nr:transcriptional repressor [bacterium]